MSKELRNSNDKLTKSSLEKGRSLLQPTAHVKDKATSDGSPRQNLSRVKDIKTGIGKTNSLHLRPKSSIQLPSQSSTMPLIRRSAGNPVTTSRTSLDSQRSSSDSRLSTDSGRRSLNNSQKKRVSERRGSGDTKSSTDTGIAELSPAMTPEKTPEEKTHETSDGNEAPRPPSGREANQVSQNKALASRLPGSRLARPYGATRGSRLASLLNKNASGIPARASQQ